MKNDNVLRRLRTQRRKWELSHRALAEILGRSSRVHMARIEAGKRFPSLEIALACQVVFGEPPHILFPHVYAEIEERIMQRMTRIHERLLQTTHPRKMRKRELLERSLHRATTRLQSKGA